MYELTKGLTQVCNWDGTCEGAVISSMPVPVLRLKNECIVNKLQRGAIPTLNGKHHFIVSSSVH
jgi:hypothetical protein